MVKGSLQDQMMRQSVSGMLIPVLQYLTLSMATQTTSDLLPSHRTVNISFRAPTIGRYTFGTLKQARQFQVLSKVIPITSCQLHFRPTVHSYVLAQTIK